MHVIIKNLLLMFSKKFQFTKINIKLEGSGFRSVLQKFGNGYNIVIHVDGETRYNFLIVAAFIAK